MMIIALLILFIFRGQLVSFLSNAYYEDEASLGSTKLIGGRAWMILFIMMLGCWLRPVTASDVVYKKLFSIMLISFMLQCFSIYGNVFTRLTDYYFQFVILYIPYFLERAEHQVLMNPNRKNEVVINSHKIYLYLSFAITVFSFIYYIEYLQGTSFFLKSFKFFWQVDPYKLYWG